MKLHIPKDWFQKGFKLRIGPRGAPPPGQTPPAPPGAAQPSASGGQPEPPVPQELKRLPSRALIESLDDADPFVRAISAEVIGRIKERGKAGGRLTRALGWLTGKTKKDSVEALIALLKDPSKYVRERAAISLGHLGDHRAVEPLIAALNDPAEEVRVTVAGVLGHLRDRLAVPALVRSLTDTSAMARMKAAISLGVIGDPEAIPALYNTLKDPHEMVRKYACEALGSIGRPAIPALLATLKDPQMRAHAAQAITKIK